MKHAFLWILCMTLACATPEALGQSAPSANSQGAGPMSPEAFLGRPVGTDFELADWDQVSTWYRGLAKSARVDVAKVGETTGGRDFLVTTISGEANMARLDEIREETRRIADPRGLTSEERAELVASATPVLFVSCSMHSTETAGTEFGMQFAWQLATSEEEPYRSAREKLVVVIVPTINPDGLDEVVHWYREQLGTAYEGAGLLSLYQHYAGHDNNRDWFGLSLEETRLVTEQIYKVWRPTVYWDVHQQGSNSERLFVPPFRDPLNPNLDPGVITGIDAIGSRALFDMTRRGFTGISTGVSYDMWWNGGNRNVPVRHNIIGLLTEAASVNIASPIFLSPGELRAPGDLPSYQPSNQFPDPWPGGWWRLADIIRYELGFGESLLGSLVRDREAYVDNAIAAAERAMQAAGAAGEPSAPRAWLLPMDNANQRGLRRLVDILDRGGVEVHAATADFEADGRSYPAGTLIVKRDQPYGQHAKDLFEVQRYPAGAAPYDVSGWTLPILFGLRRVEVVADFEVEAELVVDAADAMARRGAGALPEILGGQDGDEWAALFAALAGGERVTFRVEGELAGSFALGSALDFVADEETDEAPAEADRAEGEPAPGDKNFVLDHMPRIGLYSPWSGTMNEGWLRWVFDTYGVEYRTLRNETIRAGALAEICDVIVLPSVGSGSLDRGRRPGSLPEMYARGLDPEGAIALEEFVRGGGRLVTMQSSALWANDLFGLELEERTRAAEDFSCPGSVLRAVPGDGPLAAGLPASVPFFFSRSYAWKVPEKEGQTTILRYAPKRVLYSGWIEGEEAIEGQAAWVRATYGKGQIDLFGFRPQYRSWSEAAFPLLFRALLL